MDAIKMKMKASTTHEYIPQRKYDCHHTLNGCNKIRTRASTTWVYCKEAYIYIYIYIYISVTERTDIYVLCTHLYEG